MKKLYLLVLHSSQQATAPVPILATFASNRFVRRQFVEAVNDNNNNNSTLLRRNYCVGDTPSVVANLEIADVFKVPRNNYEQQTECNFADLSK